MAYSILVVDDEALTLRTIGRALQAEGYAVQAPEGDLPAAASSAATAPQ